jgi:hypothetical protein
MKKNENIKWIIGVCSLLVLSSGCLKNKDIVHPDFDHSAVYFANQYPVRTIVLGEDLNVDNSLDNEHKVEIKAVLAGVRDNKNNVSIGFNVDESLLNNLYFSANGSKIVPMPANYYTLASDKINITPGNIIGGVQVQLTDAFFADPLSLINTYVVPLKMSNVQNADSILSTKNFVLYALKFVNPWHGNYLRRGKDVITYQGETSSKDTVRHKQYVENDEVNKLSTRSYTEINFPVIFKDKSGVNNTVTLVLKFGSDGICTITSGTSGVTASGNGAFVKKGEKKSWGNIDRDALYLDYQVSIPNKLNTVTKDTLVMRDRAITSEYFTPVIK